MDVIIRNLKIPENCPSCPFFHETYLCTRKLCKAMDNDEIHNCRDKRDLCCPMYAFDQKSIAAILRDYFSVGNDCYTYELTRVKEAFEIGTMTFDDFKEWDDEQVDDLAQYIIDHIYEMSI